METNIYTINKQQSPGTMTIMGDTKQVTTKRKN